MTFESTLFVGYFCLFLVFVCLFVHFFYFTCEVVRLCVSDLTEFAEELAF